MIHKKKKLGIIEGSERCINIIILLFALFVVLAVKLFFKFNINSVALLNIHEASPGRNVLFTHASLLCATSRIRSTDD